MSSQERRPNQKPYVYNSGNYILSPLSSKNISLNFISANKKENKSKNNSKIIINNISTEKPKKNLNQELIKSNPNIFALYRDNNNLYKKNIINLTENNINNVKKLYANNHNNKSYNRTNNLGNKKLSYQYLKTDINSSNTDIFKNNKKIKNIPNINIIFPLKNNFQKSNSNYYDDFFGSSNGLYKKNLSSINDKKIIKKENINFNKSPEELHWYYVKSIQEGKKYLKKFDSMD